MFLAFLFINCKKEKVNQNNDLLNSTWQTSQFKIFDSCNYQIKDDDFKSNLPPLFDCMSKSLLTFKTLSNIYSITSFKRGSIVNSQLICREAGSKEMNFNYTLKKDSIFIQYENTVKKGRFISKDSLVIFDCGPLNSYPPPGVPKHSIYLLVGELFVRKK